MATVLRVVLDNEASRGLRDLNQDLEKTAKTASSVDAGQGFDAADLAEFRRALGETANELQHLVAVAREARESTAALKSQAGAADELRAATQQSVIVQREASTSLADVALFAARAYVQYRALMALKQAALPVWKNHKLAVVGAGVAIGGVVASLLAAQAAFGAVNAVAASVSSTIQFMKDHGVGNIEELTQASDTLSASWSNLKRSLLDNAVTQSLIGSVAGGLDDISANLRLVQELGGELGTIAIEADSLSEAIGRIQEADGWKGVSQGVLALGENITATSLRVQALKSALSLVGVDADRVLGKFGLKADRSVLERANERTIADAQQADADKFLRKFQKDLNTDREADDRQRLGSLTEVNAAIEEQKRLLKEVADGTTGSADKIKASERELARLREDRKRLVQELAQQEERIGQIARSGQAQYLKDEAEEFQSIESVKRAQEGLLKTLRTLNSEHRLTKEILDDTNQRFQVYEQRKVQLIQERTKAEQEYQRVLKAVGDENKKLVQERANKIKEEADAKLQELRDAIAQAQGLNGGSLIDSLRGQISQRDIGRDVIANRQREAQQARLDELRGQGRVDQHGQAIGGTQKERAQNQRRLDHELGQIARDTLKEAFRDLRTGKVGGDEFRNAADQRIVQQAQQAMKGGKLSPEVFQQLKAQLGIDRAQHARQDELQSGVAQIQASQQTTQALQQGGQITQQLAQVTQQQLQTAETTQATLDQLQQQVEQLATVAGQQGQRAQQTRTRAQQGGLRR